MGRYRDLKAEREMRQADIEIETQTENQNEKETEGFRKIMRQVER